MPKVSIIVPNYNHVKYLPQRLDSIFNQTFQDFEIILLDDGSNDDSAELLFEYAKNAKVSHFLHNERNSGNTFVQWNRGIKLAQGEYIWIAESDDYSDLEFLENMVGILEKNIKIGMALSRSKVVLSHSSTPEDMDKGYEIRFSSEEVSVFNGKNFIAEEMIICNRIPNASAVLFRMDLVGKVGFADEAMQICSDWLQWIKFLTVCNIAVSNKYLNYYRKHETTVRSSITMEAFQYDYFLFLKKLNMVNNAKMQNHFSYQTNKGHIINELKRTFIFLIEHNVLSWREKIKKAFVLLKTNFNYTSILIFSCSLINKTGIAIRINKKAIS